MHCSLRFSVIQKKSLSLDPQGALMVTLLHKRWQQPFIKANACFCLLTTVQSLLRLMRSHTHICSILYIFTHAPSHLLRNSFIWTMHIKTQVYIDLKHLEACWVYMSGCLCYGSREPWADIHASFLPVSQSAIPPEAAFKAFFLISHHATELIHPETLLVHSVCLTQ